MSLYEKAYLAYKAAEGDDESRDSLIAAHEALGNLLNEFGTGDLSTVVSIAENYVGENAHLMEKEDVEDARAAISRLEGVYR